MAGDGHTAPAPRAGDPIRVVAGEGAGRVLGTSDLAGIAAWYDHPAPASGGPWLRANMVATVDGRASVDGRSGGLGGPVDKAVFRVLRALADVVVVGAGTARTEDYGPWQPPEELAGLRRDRGQAERPVIVQVTASGRVHTGRGMFDRPGGAAVVTTSDDPGVLARLRGLAGPDHVVVARDTGGGLDVAAVRTALAERGWARAVCEGGPTLLATLASARAVDELCLTVAPLLTGADAPRILEGGDGVPLPLRLHGLAVAGSLALTRWVRGDERDGTDGTGAGAALP